MALVTDVGWGYPPTSELLLNCSLRVFTIQKTQAPPRFGGVVESAKEEIIG
jgi:hypothetical protein